MKDQHTQGQGDSGKGSKRPISRGVLALVVAFTLSTGGIAFWLAMWGSDPLTAAQETLFDKMLSLFAVGATVIFGLVGGRELTGRG